MSAVNVQVVKQSGENSANTIRRFTKRVQGSGVLRYAKSLRYFKRSQSKYVRKSQALSRLKKRAQYQELLKLGKIVDTPKRRG